MKTAIGIDIGGTKISIALGNEKGKILSECLIPTRTGTQTRQSVRELIRNIKKLLEKYPAPKYKNLGIGAGLPGPVDPHKGTVPVSPHLGGWQGIPLRKILEKETGLPAVLANDANAAAVGEKFFGQGRGVSDFIYMTVSTGIGGGIVVNRRLLEGAGFVAGEVGHMTIVPDGDPCKCGKRGCLEAYASGTAIAGYVERQLCRGTKSILGKLKSKERVTAQIVGLAARRRDRLAIQAYERAGFYLGIGIANLLNILNPEKIILGGGVLKSSPSGFWSSMRASCKRDAWPEAIEAVKIVRSHLKGNSGNLGALALVFDKGS